MHFGRKMTFASVQNISAANLAHNRGFAVERKLALVLLKISLNPSSVEEVTAKTVSGKREKNRKL
jgi:hypothetical protein